MLKPRDLHKPLPSEDERARYLVRLLELDRRLQELRSSAELPTTKLQESAVWAQISRVPVVSGVSVEGRLRRWANLFSDEINAIHQARNRVVHNTWLSDYDLRAAVWLGEKLLALITDGEAGQLTAS